MSKNKAGTRPVQSVVLHRSSLGKSSAGRWLAVVMIVVTGLIIYSNNYNGVWLFDDYESIVENPQLRAPLSFDLLLNPGPKATALVARPVAALSFSFNHAIGGFDVRGYHLVNNIIHIFAALALFGLIRCTLLLPRFASTFAEHANWYALAVALLWESHPLVTESVTYIMCRPESMMGLFYLLTLYSAARGFHSGSPQKWYAMAIASCILGMGSKEPMVSAPLLVLLYDYLFVSGSFQAALQQRKGFYGALAASWLVIVFYQIGLPHAPGVSFYEQNIRVIDYFRTQMTVIVHYLRLSFWPHPLVLDSQDWPIIRDWSHILILPAIILGTIAVASVLGVVRKRWWSILGVGFFAVLAPTSSVIPLLGEIVSERRMYLPLTFVVVFVVFAMDYLWRKLVGRFSSQRNLLLFVPAGVAAVLVTVMGYMSWERNLDYRTAVSIWTDTVNKRPANFRARGNLGKALAREGRFSEAVESFENAVRVFPPDRPPELGLGEIYSAWGAALTQLGKIQEAFSMHRKAVDLNPGEGLVYYRLGNTYLKVNDLDNAAAAFQRAISFTPDYYRAHGNLAMILIQKGEYGQAEYYLQELISMTPEKAVALSMLASLRMAQGRFEEAEQLIRQALTLEPDNHNIRGQLKSITDVIRQQ